MTDQKSKSLELVGYEMLPQDKFQRDLMNYLKRPQRILPDGSPELPPSPGQPVYRDDEGTQFVALPGKDGLEAIPFLAGPPVDDAEEAANGQGGYVPLEMMPPPRSADNDADSVLAQMAENMPGQMTSDWLGNAAKNMVLGAGPGGMMDAAMKTLGISNPLASGPLGSALGAAAAAAGLGPMGSLLPATGNLLNGGSVEAFAQALGTGGLNQLASCVGLGGVPGANAAASIVGGQLGGQLGGIFDGGGLDELSNHIDNFLPTGFPGSATSPGGIPDPTNGGCFPDPKEQKKQAEAAEGQAVDAVADQLLSQWEVDDESSAAEHIANKAVNDYKGEVTDIVKGEVLSHEGKGISALKARVQGFFAGKPPGTGKPIARMKDLDITPSEKVGEGVANIKAEGECVTRKGDKLDPSQALILEGSPTVLTAGELTAFLGAKTDSPGVAIAQGAPSVLVDVPPSANAGPGSAPGPNNKGNAGPKGPEDPKDAKSGSGQSDGEGDGDEETGATDDSTPADGETSPDNEKRPATEEDACKVKEIDERSKELAKADQELEARRDDMSPEEYAKEKARLHAESDKLNEEYRRLDDEVDLGDPNNPVSREDADLKCGKTDELEVPPPDENPPENTGPGENQPPSEKQQPPDDGDWKERDGYKIKEEQQGNKKTTTIRYDDGTGKGKTVVITEEVQNQDSALGGFVETEQKWVTTQTLDENGQQIRVEKKYVDETRIGGDSMGIKYSQEAGGGGSVDGGASGNAGSKISTGVYVGDDYLGVTASAGVGGGATNSDYGKYGEHSINTPVGGFEYKDLPDGETVSGEVGVKNVGTLGVESVKTRDP